MTIRFVVAAGDGPVAFLRAKSADALAATWTGRSWEAFRSPPEILDVTDQMQDWLAAGAPPVFSRTHGALGHAACAALTPIDSDWTPGAFCWVVAEDGIRCRAFAQSEAQEAAHTAATRHDDWLIVHPRTEPGVNPGVRTRRIGGGVP